MSLTMKLLRNALCPNKPLGISNDYRKALDSLKPDNTQEHFMVVDSIFLENVKVNLE
jgi:hypothetical protein